MKFVTICNKKSKIKLIRTRKCNSEDLVLMSSGILNATIDLLVEENNISRKESIKIVKEIMNECVFN